MIKEREGLVRKEGRQYNSRDLQKNVAPNTPQFNPVEILYCLTEAFFKTAIVAPVVAPAKAFFYSYLVSRLILFFRMISFFQIYP